MTRANSWYCNVVSFRMSVVGPALFDVVVERAAGIFHEHAFEGGRTAVLNCDFGLEPLRRAFRRESTAGQDSNSSTKPIGFGKVVRRENDRGVVIGL